MIWAKTTETLSKRKEEETPKHYGQEYIFILKLTIIIWFFRKRKKKTLSHARFKISMSIGISMSRFYGNIDKNFGELYEN